MVDFHGFSRWFHGFSWILVGFLPAVGRLWPSDDDDDNDEFCKIALPGGRSPTATRDGVCKASTQVKNAIKEQIEEIFSM